MEPESSLPYSQVPATCPYPEPTTSSPHNPLPLPEDPFIIGLPIIISNTRVSISLLSVPTLIELSNMIDHKHLLNSTSGFFAVIRVSETSNT